MSDESIDPNYRAGYSAGAAEVRERLRALVCSEEADRFRDEACRGVVGLPYASNRYIRLLDSVRAALEGDRASE